MGKQLLLLEFLLAMLPIIWLIAALSGLKMAGHKACVIALAVTAALAAGYWGLSALCIATAALEGVLNALWPICLVIVAALFTYNLTLKTGAMENVKRMLAGVSRDKRVLALIIGWGFGNFMEGMAGFGTAVAIPASMLAAIGLDPMSAVLGCLVVNSTPTAFGSVGVPTVTLSSVTGTELVPLAGSIVNIQCILTFLSPFLMVCICGKGIRALKGMMPTTLVAAASFTIPWFITAHFIGPELPDIIGSICSMGCMIAAARIFNKDPEQEYTIEISGEAGKEKAIGAAEGLKAWSSFILIFLFLMPLINMVPMACLAAVLIVVSYNMSGWRTVVGIFKSPKSDISVLLVTFLLTVIFDLTIAIEIGLLLAIILFLRRVMENTQIKVYSEQLDVAEGTDATTHEVLDVSRGVEVYEIDGPFFFGVATKFDEMMRSTLGTKPIVRIIRMRKVPFIDATAVHNLEILIKSSQSDNIHIVLSGVNQQVRQVLLKAGIDTMIGEDHICDNISRAVVMANRIADKHRARHHDA